MVWSTQVEMHFVSLLEWDGFGQHLFRCILPPHWPGMGLVSTGSDTFLVLADMGWVWSTYVVMHFVSSLAWEGFWSTHVELVFESTLPWDVFENHVLRCILCITWHRDGFDQDKLIYILCPGWIWMSLVYTSSDAFCVLAGMGGVWSSCAEMHFFICWHEVSFGKQ